MPSPNDLGVLQLEPPPIADEGTTDPFFLHKATACRCYAGTASNSHLSAQQLSGVAL